MQSAASFKSGTSPALSSQLLKNKGVRTGGEVRSAAHKVMVQIRVACCVGKGRIREKGESREVSRREREQSEMGDWKGGRGLERSLGGRL